MCEEVIEHEHGMYTGKCWVLRTIKGEPAAEEGMCPTEPDPRWGPESIVCGQLEALRCAEQFFLFLIRSGPFRVHCICCTVAEGSEGARREGDVERALSFVAFPVEDDASSSSRPSLVHRIPAYAPLMYHHGYNVAATAQVSADASVIFVGEITPDTAICSQRRTGRCHCRIYEVENDVFLCMHAGVHGQRTVEGGTDPAQYMLPYMWFLSLHQGTTWMIDTVQHVSGA